ncbi:Actin-related protein 2/3 complex subunit 3 [Phytophthora cinnamomi]|uniref:Actin-related protein 2/3 complex subunit 3 n=1 Tax=Phytophthora cinnamomi TaxID=4785 RepID=UPI00355A2065|nr:Actin-related protein 2/3 complex subunit 3 [Phytophthora cinnamomi]
MSLQDFVHHYEMESLQLGITARRDVTLRMMEFFPSPEDDGLSSNFQATSQALAARRTAERSKNEETGSNACTGRQHARGLPPPTA